MPAGNLDPPGQRDRGSHDWVANTGTTPIGRVQIGDSVNKTWTINYDNVVVDLP